MPTLKNFVAVDWRAGKDQIYFFFKDTNTYARFDIGDNEVAEGYPREINAKSWSTFHSYAKNLRFGFTTTGISATHPLDFDSDILWFFYYEGDTPMVCKYDQDFDAVDRIDRVADSPWKQLLPYFDHIVAGTWRQSALHPKSFRFLLNNGYSIDLELVRNTLTYKAITDKSWPGLAPYKDRIITAVQNDRSFADSYYYIFLTNNEYLRYNLWLNTMDAGPIGVDNVSWPGLLQD